MSSPETEDGEFAQTYVEATGKGGRTFVGLK